MRMSPTQEAAMRMALEALHEIGWSNNTRWQSDRAATVIPALRGALAEPVQEPVGVVTSMVKGGVTWHRWPGDMPDGTTLYTAPPQRPAEPTV